MFPAVMMLDVCTVFLIFFIPYREESNWSQKTVLHLFQRGE